MPANVYVRHTGSDSVEPAAHCQYAAHEAGLQPFHCLLCVPARAKNRCSVCICCNRCMRPAQDFSSAYTYVLHMCYICVTYVLHMCYICVTQSSACASVHAFVLAALFSLQGSRSCVSPCILRCICLHLYCLQCHWRCNRRTQQWLNSAVAFSNPILSASAGAWKPSSMLQA
jgi:hypothetical protein